jgi:cbb3-type cytochrome oxidase subunit 3
MNIDLARAGEAGLLLFLLIFLAVTVWAFTRSRREIDHWAELPLETDPQQKNQDRL